MATIIRGPWVSALLSESWFCSVNDGASAFSVLADTREQATTAAIDRIWSDLSAHIDPCCPFTMDAAESELRVLLERMRIYSPQEWTAHVLEESQMALARWRRHHPEAQPEGAA